MPFAIVQGPEGKIIPDNLAGRFRTMVASGLSVPGYYQVDPDDPEISASCILPAPEVGLADGDIHLTAIGTDMTVRRGVDDERANTVVGPGLLEAVRELIDDHHELAWVRNPRVLLAIGNRPREFSVASANGMEVEPWWLPQDANTIIARCFWASHFRGERYAAEITPEFVVSQGAEESGLEIFGSTLKRIGETLMGASVVVQHYFIDTSIEGNRRRRYRQDNAATVTVSWGLPDAMDVLARRTEFHAQTIKQAGIVLVERLGEEAFIFSTAEQGVSQPSQTIGWTGDPRGESFDPNAR